MQVAVSSGSGPRSVRGSDLGTTEGEGRRRMTQPARSSNESHLDELAHDLAAELELPLEVVEPVVSESYRTLAQSRITSFLPILVRRHARRELLRRAGGAVA